MGIKGYVMNIQPFSVNDGDGIRTTVFLAGCPLRCRWCCNPEGLTMEEKVNQNTGESMVSLMDADEVIDRVQKHRLFYSYSRGGITFSGGEATGQTEFLDYLSQEIFDLGYSMAIETCGMFDWDKTEHILRRMDLIFADIKLMDAERHKKWTGVSNEKILENIIKLGKLGACSTDVIPGSDAETGGFTPRVVIRIPVIGGVNDDEENVRATAVFVRKHLPGAGVELLPYHEFGRIKYEALGMEYNHPEFHTPGKKEMDRLKDIIKSEGVDLVDYR